MPEIKDYMKQRGQNDNDFAEKIEQMFQQISERLTVIEEAVIPDTEEGEQNAD